MEGVMTPGRPSPHPQGSTGPQVEAIVGTCGARSVRPTEYAVRVCGHRVARTTGRCGGGFCRRAECRGEQPGRERPHPRNPEPDPRVGCGVAHVPAACLKSCAGLRTPMSRTIDSGSNRQCMRQRGARFGTIRDRLSAAMTRVMERTIWRHISPPGCSEITRPPRFGFSCGARRRQRSPLRSDRAFRTAFGR